MTTASALLALLALAGSGHCRFETVLYASKSAVDSFFGTDQAKLVYVNKSDAASPLKSLEFIDFSEPVLRVQRIAAAVMPCVPVISPDGRWVTYASSTGNGEAGTNIADPSSVYICELKADAVPKKLYAGAAYEPRFVKSMRRATLSVIFPTQSSDFSWEGGGETMIVDVDTAGGTPMPGAPRVLCPYGSYSGGLSDDSAWLCSGSGLAVIINLKGGKTRPDTVGPIGFGTASAYGAQACNISMTSALDTTDRVMFLDFGGSDKDGRMGGKSWAPWQIIFVANSKKQLVAWYQVPSDDPAHPYEIAAPAALGGLDSAFTRWHHPEWSNHPYFATATINLRRLWGKDPVTSIWQATEKQERIAFIDLRQPGRYLTVLGPDSVELAWDFMRNGDNLCWPWLWVKVPQSMSAGPQRQHRPLRHGPGFDIQRDRLLSRGNIMTDIRIFSLDGRKVMHAAFPHGARVCGLGCLRSGLYAAQALFADGQRSTMVFPAPGSPPD
jgi:hypothetical protein